MDEPWSSGRHAASHTDPVHGSDDRTAIDPYAYPDDDARAYLRPRAPYEQADSSPTELWPSGHHGRPTSAWREPWPAEYDDQPQDSVTDLWPREFGERFEAPPTEPWPAEYEEQPDSLEATANYRRALDDQANNGNPTNVWEPGAGASVASSTMAWAPEEISTGSDWQPAEEYGYQDASEYELDDVESDGQPHSRRGPRRNEGRVKRTTVLLTVATAGALGIGISIAAGSVIDGNQPHETAAPVGHTGVVTTPSPTDSGTSPATTSTASGGSPQTSNAGPAPALPASQPSGAAVTTHSAPPVTSSAPASPPSSNSPQPPPPTTSQPTPPSQSSPPSDPCGFICISW